VKANGKPVPATTRKPDLDSEEILIPLMKTLLIWALFDLRPSDRLRWSSYSPCPPPWPEGTPRTMSCAWEIRLPSG